MSAAVCEADILRMDRHDRLLEFRKEFFILENTIYMDGNSLGLQCRAAARRVEQVMNDWRNRGIGGWMDGTPAWFTLSETLGEMAAPLVGALPGEVVATGTTTVNIHSLVASFFNPLPGKDKILADELNFPTDLYALDGQLRLRGLDPVRHLVRVRSGDGRTLDEEKIIAAMTEDVALVFLPSVLFTSGQLLDMPRLSAAAREREILIGFDCSHSAGAVPHQLHKWGIDFALWCSYKYLNGGPGSPAFLFVHERHHGSRHPRLPGWFGFVKEKQFDLLPDFIPQPDAGAWQISSPGILGAAAVAGALEVIREAGIDAIRKRSLLLTDLLMRLVDERLSHPPYSFRIVNPQEDGRRGGHVALARDHESLRIAAALKARGIIPDFRPPDTIRIAPVALYNTAQEVYRVVQALVEIIDNREYTRFPTTRGAIT
ncbi:MAG TPA: kynureninase [Candidatus Aminicenantes bacterium]|nr:kynureninase [Candidatus Aminicenantes bacterium]